MLDRNESLLIWEKLKKNQEGWVVAIVQDESAHVLMQAFQNRDAFIRSLESDLMYYYSRSRNCLWLKGESSGHYQHIKDVAVDCDADTLLYTVRQEGAACHTGAYSCFYRSLSEL